ncbi:RHS repeat-associated core domain-containing protein [Pseudomonas sp. NFACC05-1]|uniref:RHS repeat-associated core domain-containing protein n=1 Tax=Pseudomonas sp. NFACC05-1 TaxID=1566241 RepID=UPI0021142D38|nr:RHS repeat-associated core domain-containing protein [Pseudomonas sp. NFACC05-1]
MTRSRPDDVHSRQSQTILLAADDKHSILAEVSESQTRSIAYSAYGQQSTQQMIATKLGFNGELREARLGWYFLGKGYRVYNPVLMRFHSPDSLSPFGKGGLNAYMYCVGDPVNFSDPTGHVGQGRRLVLPSRSSAPAPSLDSLTRSSRSTTANVYTTGSQPVRTEPTIIAPPPPPPTTQTQPTTNVTQRVREIPPPPRPLKSTPRFNDSGGQVSLISPDERSMELIWDNGPVKDGRIPVPPPRTWGNNAEHVYHVKYDPSGNPIQITRTLKVLMPLPEQNSNIRNTS